MSRRVSLPGADELFRSTRTEAGREGADIRVDPAVEPQPPTPPQAPEPADRQRREASGRVRHDEKITVYVTADELLDLERTRLVLRGDHGLAVDRGRIVREAIHLAIQGVQSDGEASALVRRLREP